MHEGRFVSEFGMLSAPHPATIASFAPPSECTPLSPTVAWHLKADGGAERLAHYLRSLPEPVDLEGWVHATQVIQADAMTTAITAWRRRWGVPGHRAVGGALVWQLNDCWPALSWSLVDHLLRPKGAWYAVGRALAPLALGIAEPLDAPAVWAMNATDDPLEGTVHVDAWSHDGSRMGSWSRGCRLAPNATTELGTFGDAPGPTETALEVFAVAARLVIDDSVVARAALWPASLRDRPPADPGITVSPIGDGRFEVRSERPAKGVWLDAGPDVRWSDDLIDLFPDDPQVLEATGVDDLPIDIRWVNRRRG